MNGLNPYSELLPIKKIEAEPSDHDFAAAYKEFAEKPDKGGHTEIAQTDKSVSQTAPFDEHELGPKSTSPGQQAVEPLTVDGSKKVHLTEKPSRSHVADKAVSSMDDTEKNNNAEGVKDLLNILGGTNTTITPTVDQPGQSASNSVDVSAPVVAMVQLGLPQARDQAGRRADAVEGKSGTNTRQTDNNVSAAAADIETGFGTQNFKNEAVELRLSAKDKATDQSDVASATQNKTENIVVLDARRYLALAPESNAFNLVSQIAGDKELSSALTSSIIDPAKSAATSKVVNTLKLQMTPHDLGTVTATLRLRGEELSVAITVQNSAAYNHLTSDQDKMVEALRAQGFAVDQVTVQLVSADRSASQDQQPQSSSQGQQQQEARNGASAQQGRQQGNGASQDNPANRNWQNFDTGGNPAGTAATGPAERGDGQVYV